MNFKEQQCERCGHCTVKPLKMYEVTTTWFSGCDPEPRPLSKRILSEAELEDYTIRSEHVGQASVNAKFPNHVITRIKVVKHEHCSCVQGVQNPIV